jgi:DNA-binding transcriptional ArsR family regulator
VKSRVPVLAPLLRSDAQGELLALLLLHSEEEYSLSQIARLIGVGLPTVHAEITRLVSAGIVTDRRIGRARLVRAAIGHVLHKPLVELLELTYGPVAVLPELLSTISDVREAYLYGSWAARRLGEPGPAPQDVDVVVIGRPSREALLDVEERARGRLRREVNLVRIAPETWDAREDPFVRTLTSRPLVPVPLGPPTDHVHPSRNKSDPSLGTRTPEHR